MIVKKSVCGRRQRSTVRVPFEHSHHAQSIVGRNSQTTTRWNDSKMLLSSICIRRFLFYCRPREFERITFNFWLSVSESITGNDKLIPDRLKKNQKEQSMPWNKADASRTAWVRFDVSSTSMCSYRVWPHTMKFIVSTNTCSADFAKCASAERV